LSFIHPPQGAGENCNDYGRYCTNGRSNIDMSDDFQELIEAPLIIDLSVVFQDFLGFPVKLEIFVVFQELIEIDMFDVFPELMKPLVIDDSHAAIASIKTVETRAMADRVSIFCHRLGGEGAKNLKAPRGN
jgi:hypothetical protein